MNPIPATFGRPRVLLLVIHPISRDAALRALDVARESGADGAFLIDQGMEAEDVLRLAREQLRRDPGFWVGVNLGMRPSDLWMRFSDEMRVALEAGETPIVPKMIWSNNAFPLRVWWAPRWNPACPILYFGGVSFKYQVVLRDEAAPIREAIDNGVDVVTTSGPRTGVPADLDKVLRFREALGDRPLALASGVSADNVRAFLPHVDAFLVASSIEREFGVLDGEKARELADIVHGG